MVGGSSFVFYESKVSLNLKQDAIFDRILLINFENFDEHTSEAFKNHSDDFFRNFYRQDKIFHKVEINANVVDLIHAQLSKSYLKRESPLVGVYNIRKNEANLDCNVYLHPKNSSLNEYLNQTAINFMSYLQAPEYKNVSVMPEIKSNYIDENVHMMGSILLSLCGFAFLYMVSRERKNGFYKLENIYGSVKWTSYLLIDFTYFSIFALILVVCFSFISTFSFLENCEWFD